MKRVWIAMLGCLLAVPALTQTRVTYAGGAARERFNDVHQLSDGTLLVAGQAQNLDWIAPQVPRTVLNATGIDSASAGNIGFILHLAADSNSVLRVVHFPAGSVRDVFKLRTTESPGTTTGALIISGSRDNATAGGGYFLARLNGNFVTAPPTATTWTYNVSAGGDHQSRQPWDVDAEGRVVHALGAPFVTEWAAIERLDADGSRGVVPHWRAHWGSSGEWDGTPSSGYPGAIDYSAIVMKTGRKGSLRSRDAVEYFAITSDGNGNAGRRGTFPDDYYYTSHCDLAATCASATPGYTGYRPVHVNTQRVGAIAIDRRNGRIHVGYSTKSVLPGGNPDFEPGVIAMDSDGRLLWWERLYQETTENSSPDQYIDGLAIDTVGNHLVVMARAHGNNVRNFWPGNTLALTPGANGHQNQFTGTNGNIHVSWLGKLRLADGRAAHSTWLGEYNEGSINQGAAHPDPNLGGWPNPNGGWPNLNTTRCGANAGYSGELSIGTGGEVAVLCVGRRTLTTVNAHQRMPLPENGETGTWNEFVRVYRADLGGVLYSSLLTGVWNRATGAGGDNVSLLGIELQNDNVLIAGFHREEAGVAKGQPLPITDVPVWGAALPAAESAVFARLPYRASSSALFANGFE